MEESATIAEGFINAQGTSFYIEDFDGHCSLVQIKGVYHFEVKNEYITLKAYHKKSDQGQEILRKLNTSKSNKAHLKMVLSDYTAFSSKIQVESAFLNTKMDLTDEKPVAINKVVFKMLLLDDLFM